MCFIFFKKLCAKDFICTDGVYGIFLENQQLKPHRKPRYGELTEEQVQENDEITEFRGDIERKFGNLKNKFAILRKQFRHGDTDVNAEIRLCKFFKVKLIT